MIGQSAAAASADTSRTVLIARESSDSRLRGVEEDPQIDVEENKKNYEMVKAPMAVMRVPREATAEAERLMRMKEQLRGERSLRC